MVPEVDPAPDRAAAPGLSPASDPARWARLAQRIRLGDEEAMAELYRIFSRGVRFHICRTLGAQEIEDKVHDTFVIVVEAIVNGELREPERLPGFIRTVVRRQVAGFIDRAVQARKDNFDLDNGMKILDSRQNPEESAIFDEKVAIMMDVLSGINVRDREILLRYYVLEHPPEEICADLGLSDTQFRLLKSRAKARFGEIGKRKLVQKALTKFFVKNISPSGH